MKKFTRRINDSQLWLVGVGIAMGYLARWAIGEPANLNEPTRAFHQPLIEPEDDVIDLPIIRRPKDAS